MATLGDIALLISGICLIALVVWLVRRFTAKEAAWRALADLFGSSGIPGRLFGTLNDVAIHAHKTDRGLSVTVHLKSPSLRGLEITTGLHTSTGDRVMTGDSDFDRRFNVVGRTHVIYSNLGIGVRLLLSRLEAPVTLLNGVLGIELGAGESAEEFVARVHTTVEAAKGLGVADGDAALLQNMIEDPSDDVRLGAFAAALLVPALREDAIKRASESRWPALRLRASDEDAELAEVSSEPMQKTEDGGSS